MSPLGCRLLVKGLDNQEMTIDHFFNLIKQEGFGNHLTRVPKVVQVDSEQLGEFYFSRENCCRFIHDLYANKIMNGK